MRKEWRDVAVVGVVEAAFSLLGPFTEEAMGKLTPEEIERAARLHAIYSVLDENTLGQINPWNGRVVKQIVSFLKENYRAELEAWITSPGRIKLDPKRVEQVEREVKRRLGMKRKRGGGGFIWSE